MPDLDQIKQGEQGARGRGGRFSRRGRSGITAGEAERIAAVVDTFVRAINAGDFDWRLQELEDASKARAAARIAEWVALVLQPIGECLLLICCRRSNV